MNNLSLVENFPFVYLCDGREEYDNFVYLYYDKKEELNLMSSDKQIIESIFGFVPKKLLNNYTTSFLVNILDSSERFEKVSEYPIYGNIDFDLELEGVLKKLPDVIVKYYTSIIHDRETKRKGKDSKDLRIDYLEDEIKEIKDDSFKFKCKLKYEISGWKGFCEFIKREKS